YRPRMMKMRARSWALRDKFADVLRGLHSAEEAQDMVDITPRSMASMAPPEPRRSDVTDVPASGRTDEPERTRADPSPTPSPPRSLASLIGAGGAGWS